jgi:glycerate 2-kinase
VATARRVPLFTELRPHVDRIVRAAIAGGSPAPRLEALLPGRPSPRRPAVIAIGKAAPAMYNAWVRCNGEPAAKLMIVPRLSDAPSWAWRGLHPVPDQSSVAAGEALLRFVDEHRDQTGGFVVLLSGGASAIAIAPERGITVADYAEATRLLLRAGADIHALNTVRRHIDRVKGGKLRLRMAPAAAVLYAASDVLGDAPHAIGSGPLSPDPTTFADAAQVLARYRVGIPAIDRHLRAGIRGDIPENPRADDPVIAATEQSILACSAFAVRAARTQAATLGFDARLAPTVLEGPAADAARSVLGLAEQIEPPGAMLWSGETVVDVGPARGIGGRNQELALAAAIAIDGIPKLAIASFGTDGVDGPTDAAGAVVTGETCRLGRACGLDPEGALIEHDSHTFFAGLDAAGHPHLIRTGPTGVNALDITVALRY